MKSKCAISSVVHAWGLGLLFLLCGLLGAVPAAAQAPVRIINPAGGGTGDPGLRIEVYADGSYHVYRDGKRETYEGSDKMSWETAPHNIRGPQTYIALADGYNSVPDPNENNLIALQPSWVSPIYGSGTAGDPWKVQIMGKAHQDNFRSGSTDFYYTIILEYVKNNNYFYTNYLLYFTNGDLVDSDIYIFQTERVVMGADVADLTALANSECVIGYKSTESDGDGPNPSVVAAYRSTSCGAGIPAPRSHVLKMNGGSNNGSQQRFRSYFVGNETGRMTLQENILQLLPNSIQSAPATSTYVGISANKFFDSFMGDNKWEWTDPSADGYHRPSISTRMLTGYGTTPNDFDGTPVGNAPTTFGSEPPKIGFLKSTVKVGEGNSGDVQYTGNMLYITSATALPAILTADLMLEIDGVSIPVANLDGNQASTAADYKLSNGTLIKAFSNSASTDTIKIPLDSFFITGNNILQYNRAIKLQLKSNYGLLQVDGGHDTCRIIIVDDEPRDISLTPLTSTIQEGDNPTIRASLPSGVTASSDLTINLHLNSLTHTSGFSIPPTVVIPGGSDHVDFTLTTITDNIIERDDTLHISADGQIMGQNGTSTTDAVFILKDKTHTIPANMQLTLGPASATVDKGLTGQTLTASLPAGITTAIPINITLSQDAATTADPSSYSMPLQLRIDSGQASGTLTYNTRLDSIVYGPLVKHLVLNATAKDSAGNIYTPLNAIDLGINDKNWPMAHPVIVGRTAASIDEGNGSSTLWVGLPDGLVAGRDFAFAIGTSSNLTSDLHTLDGMPTDSVHITTGHSVDSFAVVSTVDDGIVGNDETVTFTAAANNLPVANNGSNTLNIVDKTVAGPPPTLLITAVSSTLQEGQTTGLKIELDSNKTLTKALNVTFSLANGTTSAGDATLNTVTYTLPASTNSVIISNAITANTDAIIEGNETFYVNATATGATVNMVPDTLTITDKTRLTPAQTALIISAPTMPAAWTKGDTKTVTVSLPAGVSTQVPISISLAPNATSEVGAGNLVLPAMPLKIDPGATSVSFSVHINTDLEVYGPLTRHLRLDGAVTDGAMPAGTFAMDSVRADITDNNWPLAHPLVISKDTIGEGSGTYAATITLPDGLKAGRDLGFNITATNSLTTGKHTLTVPATVMINAGSTSASIGNFTVPADAIIGNDEDIAFTGTYNGTGNVTDAPVTAGGVHIKDATNASALTIALTASASSLDEGQSSDVTVTLGGGMQLLQPLTITLTPQLAGTLTSGDFTLNTTTLTLPAGTSSKTFSNVLTAKTDNVLEANEPLQLSAAVTSGPVVSIADLPFIIKDKTHSIAGATQLTVTPSATNVQKGGSITLTIALASPYTTETPIQSTFTWNNTSTTGSSAYTLGSNPVVISSGSSTTVTLTAKTDNIVYGPSLHSLNLDATATDAAGSLAINNIAVTVSDNNWPLVHPLVISSGSITEGGTAYTNTITLPDGLVAGRDLDFNVSNTNGISTGAHLLAQPGAVKILNGSSSANIAGISTPVDVYVGNDEDVTYAATYTGTGAPADAPVTSGTLHISDATNATLNITLAPATTALSEDNTPTGVTLTLGGGKKLVQPIKIALVPALSGTTTAADFTLVQDTLTLPANTNTMTFTGVLQANSDLVLEDTEPLLITANVVGQPAATVSDMHFTINDLTHNSAANVVLNVAPAASALAKGNTTTLTISLPAGVTTEVPVSINFNYDAASSAASNAYTLNLPNPLVLSSGHSTTVSFQANTDKIVYGPATRSVKLLTDAHDDVKNFTINNVVVAIIDNNWPLAHPLQLSKDTITEGGPAATLQLALPDNLVAGRDLDFSLAYTNGITLGKHTIAAPAAVKVPTGSGTAGIATLSTPADAFIGNDEDITFTAVYNGSLGNPADAPVNNGSLHITDATSASLDLTLTAAKTTLDEDNNPVDVTVSINNGIVLLQPLTINLAGVNSGTTTASDYTLLQSTLTLPAGSTSKTFTGVLQANSDAVLEADEALKIKGSLPAYPTATVAGLDLTIHDLTHNNAANTVLTVTPAAGTVQKGSGTVLNIALPTGITTEVPISISFGYDATSSVSSSGYTLGSNPVVLASGNSTSTTLHFPDDKVLFWPLTYQLKLNASASDAVKPFSINNAAVNETDNNYPLQHPVLISNDTVAEGGIGTMTITLPDNLVAGHDMSFTVSTASSLTLGTHGVTAPAAPVIITAGTASATVANVSTTVDKYIGNDEDVTFSATGAFPVSDGILHIQDQSGSAVSLHLYASNSLDEGGKSQIGVQIENNLILLQPLTIQFTAVDSTTHPGDYTLLQSTVTIPAGEDSHTFADVLQANTDLILEGNEYMKLKGTVTSGQAITVPDVPFKIADLTHNNPANTVITLTPAAPTTWTKGDSRPLTVSLPAGVTTELPIVLNTAPTVASQLTAASYNLPAPITLGSGNDTVVTMQLLADNYVYGPQTMHLQVGGSALDPVFSSYTVGNADLDVADNNYATLGSLALILDASTITEGGAATKLTLALPGSLKAGRDLAFAIKAVSDLASHAHVIAWPTDSVHFAYGDHSITVALPQAATDKVIGNNENITVTAAATGFTVSGTTLHIADATAADPVSGKVTLGSSAANVLEGHSIQLTASLGAGVTATQDVVVSLAANAASTAGSTDYSLPASITIPAGSSSASITLDANTDNILEPAELLRIDGTSTGLTVTSTAVQIDDATHLDPANTALQITIDSSSIIKGHSTKVTISFVNTSITTAQAFNIAVSAAGASTAAATDYNALPTALQMPAGAGSTSFTLQTLNNNLNETTVALVLAGNTTGYTITNSNALDILTLIQLTVQIVKTKDAAEPATDGAFTVQLPAGTVAAADITVTLNIDNTGATANFVTPPTQVTIPAGAGSVTVPVVIKDDYILQGDGELTATVVSATSASGTILVDNTPAVMTITDDENAPTGPKAAARKIVIEKISDARKPASNGAFRIRFADARVSVAKDVQVSYIASGDAAADGDYHALPGTVVIPAFETEAVVNVVPILNDNVFKDVTATFTLDQVSSAMKSVNWNISDTAAFADILIRDNNGVPDTAMAIIGPNRWTDDTTRKIRVHPALSPNGDGVGNDAMYVENINKFPENEVTVFNRWGATVFHTRNYDNLTNNFAGRYNVNGSGDVPEGTYYYIIIINDHGKQERYTGFVVIRR